MGQRDKEVESAMGSRAHASRNENVQADLGLSNQKFGDENTVNINGDGAKKRKLRSLVPDHFERKVIEGKWKEHCNYCRNSLGEASKNSTEHLHDQMETCVDKRQRSVNKQYLLSPTKSSDGPQSLTAYHFNPDHTSVVLAKMIVLNEYPLSMVQHSGFTRFSHSVQPLFKVVSQNTIKSDIMKVFECERKKTMKLLDANASRIALTIDMWTSSNRKRRFMAITSHFIDDSWKQQSRLIRFIYVPYPHTDELLSDAVVGCVLDWNLDRKLSTMTTDNCTSNDAMIKLSLNKLPPSSLMLEGRLFHMRCFAHILYLAVSDGLMLISDTIEKVRSSIVFWTATPKRDEMFVETVKQLKIPNNKKLELDCETRGKSTYLMLITAMEYKDVFASLKRHEPLYDNAPTEEEWSKVREISTKLEIFFYSIEFLSTAKCPTTVNHFFPTICEIKLTIADWHESDEIELKTMASNIKEKFDKYWDSINCTFAIGSILDPRCKLKAVQLYYPLVYGEMSSREIQGVKKVLNDMIEEYKKRSKQSQVVQQSSQPSSSSSRPIQPKRSSSAMRFEMFMKSIAKTEHVKSELDSYLEDSLLPINTIDFDILWWWKTYGIRYPTLCDIAKDVLAIPAMVVDLESTFSSSGRVISTHRSTLHPTTMEALMCARDWLWSEIEGSITSEVRMFDNDSDTEAL